MLKFRSVPRCFTKGEQLQYQSGRRYGTEKNMSVRRVRRRNAMPCDAMLCHAEDETRRRQARLVSQGLHAALFACRLPPTAWQSSNGCYHRHSTCIGNTPRYHRAGCNRSNGLAPRRRGQLSEVPINPLSSANLIGSSGRSEGQHILIRIQSPAFRSSQAVQKSRWPV